MSDDGDTNVVKEQPGSCEGPKNSLVCLIMKTKIKIFILWICLAIMNNMFGRLRIAHLR